MGNDSIEDTLWPILVYQQISGVCRKTANRVPTTFTLWCRKLYSLLIAGTMAGLYVHSVILFLRYHYIFLAYGTLQIIHVLYILLINVIWDRNVFEVLILRIQEMDYLFKSEHRRNFLRQDKCRNLIVIGLLIPYHIIYIAIDVYAAMKHNFNMFFHVPFTIITVITFDLELILFCVILSSTIKRVEVLNIFFKNKPNIVTSADDIYGGPQCDPNSNNHFTFMLPLNENSTYNLSQFYVHLLDLCHHLNKIFDFQLLTSLALMFSATLVNMYVFLRDFKYKKLDISLSVSFMLFPFPYIMLLVAVCLLCEKIYLQIETTKFHLTSLQVNEELSPTVQHNIQLIKTMIEASELGQFTIFQSFKMRASLLLHFLGLLTSYTVVLIQFMNVNDLL